MQSLFPVFALDQLEQIEKVEQTLFKENYKNENVEARINRIENFLFKKTYSLEPISNRTERIFKGFPQEEQQTVNKQSQNTEDINPIERTPAEKEIETKPVMSYKDRYDKGVLETISEIEEKLFKSSSPNEPLPTRVKRIEDKLLTRSEKAQINNKSTLEKISFLVNKSKLREDKNDVITETNENEESFVIDKSSGYLINKKTGEYLIDNSGNPVSINMNNNALDPSNLLFGGNPLDGTGDLDPSNPLSLLLLQKQLESMNGFPNQLPNNLMPPNLPQGIPPELLFQFQMQSGIQGDLDF